MSYNIEQFSFSPQDYGAELTSQSHQTIYWLNRNGYLDNDAAEHLLKHMIVVPIKNKPTFGRRLLSRFFGKDSSDSSYVFPITLLDVNETYASHNTDDKPKLTIVKKINNIMFELFILLVVAVVAYNAGVSVTAWRLRDLVYKEAKARGLVSKEDVALFEGEQKKTPKVFKLCIEKSQDTLYLYDHEKNDFVCQGKTVDELAKLALEYKNIRYAAVIMSDCSDAMAFVDGVVKTTI